MPLQTHICSPKPQKLLDLPEAPLDLKVNIRGYGNTVSVKSADFRAAIRIYGCNNTIVVEEGCLSYAPSQIWIGDKNTPCFGCEIRIGRGGCYNKLDLRAFDRGSRIIIGRDCLMSWDVMIWGSDTHAVFDADGKLRRGNEIVIGDHVWVGHGCYIGKNTHIASHCIVGWGSTVTGRFEESHCVLAGSPARIVKRGVRWDMKRPDDYIPERTADMEQYADWAEELPSAAQSQLSTASKVKLAAKVLLWRCLLAMPNTAGNKAAIGARYHAAMQQLCSVLLQSC